MCCIYLTKPYHHHEYLETSTSNAMENKAKVCGSQRRHIHPAAGHRLGNKRKAHTGHHANGQGTLWMHASPRKYTSNCHLRKKGKTISRVIRNASVSSTLVQNEGEERCTHPDRQQWGPKPPAVTNHHTNQNNNIYYLLVLEVTNPTGVSMGWNQGVSRAASLWKLYGRTHFLVFRDAAPLGLGPLPTPSQDITNLCLLSHSLSLALLPPSNKHPRDHTVLTQTNQAHPPNHICKIPSAT